MSTLVIVESPTKAKTLRGILSSQFEIKASNGHIRDLPKSGLGVDVDNDFTPEYEVPDKSKKIISELRKEAEDKETIVLATDPDREGEAIAWHLKYLLENLGKPSKKGKKKEEPEVAPKKYTRVVFHELTKSAIDEAFENMGEINVNLVDAQQARRVLDRLVGYKLSPLLWKKVRFGLSAGRVQSVAVRLIVERERERTDFKPDEYWVIKGNFVDKDKKRSLEAELLEFNEKKLKVTTGGEADKIDNELKNDSFAIQEIKKTERKKNAYPPFKTSTLQQTMANIFGFNARRTMSAAQKLFEKGFITYHRTDSFNLSPVFINSARNYISKEFGAKFIPDTPNFYRTKSANAQEAHEAIRPTEVSRSPKNKLNLTDDEFKVYSIIWKRGLECQMNPAIYDQTSINVLSNKGYLFRATGSIVKFDGWLYVSKFLNISDEDEETSNQLPEYSENEIVDLEKLNLEQKFTQPPARYNDASLIKKLEELGIGRPSTYAPTISTIETRGYTQREGRAFVPTDVAFVVTDLLVTHFPNVVSYDFTAQVEAELDEIAEGTKQWVPVIREFYVPFEKIVAQKDLELKKVDVTNLGESDEVCPDCGKKLLFKLGKYGKFLSCSAYPECKYARPLVVELDENGNQIDYGKCPNCSDGVFILKQGKFGKFLACSNYPKCKTAQPFLEKIGVKCPKCKEGDVVVKKAKRRVFYGCSRYPECDYSNWKKPVEGEAYVERVKRQKKKKSAKSVE